MKCPCEGCVAPERHIGCHSDCHKKPSYAEWAAEKKAEGYKRFQEKEVDDYVRQTRKRFHGYKRYKETKKVGRCE